MKNSNQKTSYAKLTAKIMGFTLVVTLLIAYAYGEYLKNQSIKVLSKSDAKQTSMLIFESLYTAMEKGWTRDDLEKIMKRLNHVNKDLKVDVYRSEKVVENFGEISKDKVARETNQHIKNAMNGNEVLNILEDDKIEYFYPIIAENNCLTCHTKAKKGDILGVIDVNYPVVDLKVSLNDMINFFIFFIIIFTSILFLILFLELDRYLLKPIKNFVSTINIISKSHDITKRIDTKNDVDEIHSMQEVFNGMLDSIEFQFYNDTLTKLPNRKKLIELLDKKENHVFMIVNIDNFKEINDLYGHSEGDVILKEFATFLETKIPKECTLFKLHADEYGLLFSINFDLDFFVNFTNILIEDINKAKFDVDNGKSNIFINSTIGISYGDNSLLTNSDIALNLAKKRKKDFLIYDTSMQIEHEYEQNLKWTKK